MGSDFGESYDSSSDGAAELDWEGKPEEVDNGSVDSEICEEANAGNVEMNKSKAGLDKYDDAPEITLELDEQGEKQFASYLKRRKITQREIELTAIDTID